MDNEEDVWTDPQLEDGLRERMITLLEAEVMAEGQVYDPRELLRRCREMAVVIFDTAHSLTSIAEQFDNWARSQAERGDPGQAQWHAKRRNVLRTKTLSMVEAAALMKTAVDAFERHMRSEN